MMRKNIIFAAILVSLQFYNSLYAAPMTADQAEMVVTGWLEGNSRPLGANLGRQVIRVETFTNKDNETIYYIVYLQPSGFVIISADNLVEPIIGFSDEGTYNPSLENPLGVLVTNDLSRRIETARSNIRLFSTGTEPSLTSNQKKWNSLINRSAESADGLRLMSTVDSLSDIRVLPLIRSWWGQYYVCGVTCFNYYTPNNYPSGCVATAMAQLMRHHRHPVEPNDYDTNEPGGRRRFWVSVMVDDGVQIDQRFLRGGDGVGGPYDWEQMVLKPDCSTTLEQRQAIGAICYDAGIATGMVYSEGGSGAYSWDIPYALREVFNYSNAINSLSEDSNEIFEIEGQPLEDMVNTNLDAGCPVILGISDFNNRGGHAVLCDGYGYEDSTLYHRLNLGYEFVPAECRAIWYDLPDVSDECRWREGYYIYIFNYDYDNIIECVYNIFVDETGEIVSGRVVDRDGIAIKDAVVTARGSGSAKVYTSTSDRKGIYALKGLDSNTAYTLTADKVGFDFESNQVITGISVNGSPVSGNKWGVNLTGYSNCEAVTIGAEGTEWEYPLRTRYEDCRTQVIYLASEIGRSGFITSLQLYVNQSPDQELENWTIRMKHTNLSEYVSSACLLEADGWTMVYQNSERISGGWAKFEFQTPFEYNGVDNLMVDFSFNNSSYSEDDGLCYVSRPGGRRSVYASSDSRHGDPLDWPATTPPSIRCSIYMPNVKLTLGEQTTIIRKDDGYLKLTAYNSERDDNFGHVVSISGDYAIVGSRGGDIDGSAYIFRREGSIWTQQVKLTAPLGYVDPDGRFGCSVSISGDYAVIGARGYHGHHGSGMGAVFIFNRSGTSWSHQVTLTPSDGESFACFGDSVSICGDYAIVGVPGDDNENVSSGINYGSAYIFKRDNTGWTEQAKLFASDGDRYKSFGDVVSIDGDYAIIANQPSTQGVYIFKREGSIWTEQAKMTGLEGLNVSSVSINGDYAVVGAVNSAYIFERAGESWGQQAMLTGLEGVTGESVSINGDYVIVGAPNYDDEINGRDSGCVYVFKREGTNCIQHIKLTARESANGDHFGSSVSVDGDYVIVGAKGDDDNGMDSGSAYIFKLE